MQQLLAQKVGVIIFYPLDPKATTPVLKQAQRQGVPVVAIDASFGSTKKVPLITTQVWQSRDTQAFLQATGAEEGEAERQGRHHRHRDSGAGDQVPGRSARPSGQRRPA